MDKILITGGCGFVGSSLAFAMKKKYGGAKIYCFDNLKRRGSELNVGRLQDFGIEFVHGDIRNPEDIESVGGFDLLLECSAEPSVLAGYNSSPTYLINTNLVGTLNCLESVRKHKANMVFLSTSRVYPISPIENLNYYETETRFELSDEQDVDGVSSKGLNEEFPINGIRSLYGATKLSSELIIQEYAEMYNLKLLINRCGLLTGPWQFGKIDQGVIVFWVAKHFWKGSLSYIGYGGTGKQVRDLLHVKDLNNLIEIQISNINKFSGNIYNVGGGKDVSLSLLELTELCVKYTGSSINIGRVKKTRVADIPVYLSDSSKVTDATGWKPKIFPNEIISEIVRWIKDNNLLLERILK